MEEQKSAEAACFQIKSESELIFNYPVLHFYFNTRQMRIPQRNYTFFSTRHEKVKSC